MKPLILSLFLPCAVLGFGCGEGDGSYYPDATAGSETSGAGAGGTEAPTEQGGTSGEGTGLGMGMGGGDTETPTPMLPEVARIMAIGDSITASQCWRALLWGQLDAAFPARFEFVGSHQSNGAGCMPANYDQDNEGYGSSLVTEVVAGVTTNRTCQPACPTLTVLQEHFTATPADIALLHYATNDVWNGITPDAIVGAHTQIVGALRAANPNVVILAAQIIPLNPTTATCPTCDCPTCMSRVPLLNMRIATWATETSTTASPVIVVDQFTGFDVMADTREGVHPSATGDQKLADKWFAALEPLFSAAQ